MSAVHKHTAGVGMLRAQLEVHKRLDGEEAQSTLITFWALAGTVRAQGRPAEAERMLHEVIEGMKRALGANNELTLSAIVSLAACLCHQESWESLAEAETVLREVLPTLTRVLGDNHPRTQKARQWQVVVEDHARAALPPSALAQPPPAAETSADRPSTSSSSRPGPKREAEEAKGAPSKKGRS